ncbi:MAG: hypothetical protein WAT66_10580 [Actinomycetota bacterium]
MKTKGITKKLLGITISAISMVLTLGPIGAWAVRAEPDPHFPTVAPHPMAPAVQVQDTSSGRAWIIPLIIGGVLVLAAAVIGRVRIRRSRGVAWGA